MQLTKVFLYGMIISFLGSIPLGALNLVTTYISVANGKTAAILFAGGCIVSELIFVRLALTAMNWISKRQKLFKILEWITIIIILALAICSFSAAYRGTEFSRSMPGEIKQPFWSGILLSALDPMKIPFWFLWSTFLIGNKILLPRNSYYNLYVIGIGLGSLLGFMVFVYSGIYLIGTIKSHQNMVNWTIGGILTVTVVISVYRALQRKNDQLLVDKNSEELHFFYE